MVVELALTTLHSNFQDNPGAPDGLEYAQVRRCDASFVHSCAVPLGLVSLAAFVGSLLLREFGIASMIVARMWAGLASLLLWSSSYACAGFSCNISLSRLFFWAGALCRLLRAMPESSLIL